ncbi:MAG: glycerate kinase [Anaerolineae bacterium]
MEFAAPDPHARPGWSDALEILAASIDAADPRMAVRRHLVVDDGLLRADGAEVDLAETRRVILVGAGKAAVAMAGAVEDALGERLTAGVVVTQRGGVRAGGWRPSAGRRTVVLEAGHPVPDQAGLDATRRMARLLDDTTADDLVIAVVSGGASALLEMPAGRIPLADIQAATTALLASGAPIEDMNAVRKHVSAVKGGGLARLAAPARLITLVLSDVVGSPIDVIASGPTTPDESTFEDAAAALTRHGLWSVIPASVANHIKSGIEGRVPETARIGDAAFDRASTIVVGDNASATDASLARAAEMGYQAMLLTTFLEGEASECGAVMAAIGKEIVASGRPVAPPACVVAGGETTVTLASGTAASAHSQDAAPRGVGGRNQELALAAALALEGWPSVTLGSMDTDGIDGRTVAAGAIVDGATVARARELGLDPVRALAGHDSGRLFEELGDAIVSGPTGTNVNDITVLLVGPAPSTGRRPPSAQ